MNQDPEFFCFGFGKNERVDKLNYNYFILGLWILDAENSRSSGFNLNCVFGRLVLFKSCFYIMYRYKVFFYFSNMLK